MSVDDMTGKARELWNSNVKGAYDAAVDKVKNTADKVFGDDTEDITTSGVPVSVTEVNPESVEVIYNTRGSEAADSIRDFIRMIIDHGVTDVQEPVVVMYAGVIYDLDDVYVSVDSDLGLTHVMSMDDLLSDLSEDASAVEIAPGEIVDWDHVRVSILAEQDIQM